MKGLVIKAEENNVRYSISKLVNTVRTDLESMCLRQRALQLASQSYTTSQSHIDSFNLLTITNRTIIYRD